MSTRHFKRIILIMGVLTLAVAGGVFWGCEKGQPTTPQLKLKLASTSGLAGDGVNLQPSYYCSGDMDLGWDLMNQYSKIKTLRIEMDPGEGATVEDFARWIQEANDNGYDVIATYHNYQDNGSADPSTLQQAADWWVDNWNTLSSAGSFTMNLMNEWGDHSVTSEQYADAYNSAINTVRQVYSGPIICDIPGWGQETHVAADASSSINDDNIIFSVHIYTNGWNEKAGHNLCESDLDYLEDAGRPCMVGEFGSGDDGSVDWSALVDYANSKGWSVIGWCWNGDGSDPPMNMIDPFWGDDCDATSYTTSSYFNTIYSKLGGGGGTTTTTAATTTTTTSGTTTTTIESGEVCSPATAKSLPFSYDGSGENCWSFSSTPEYINSWNLETLEVNGVDFTNSYCSAGNLPDKVDGKYYVYYVGNHSWSHFEAAGATETTTTTAEMTTTTAETTTTTAETTTTTAETTTTTTAAAGCTCDAGCDSRTTISIPFTQDGEGEYCWETSSLGDYINSWNLDKLEVNDVDYTNSWSNSFPDKIDGKYYIYYKGSYPWSHFEAN